MATEKLKNYIDSKAAQIFHKNSKVTATASKEEKQKKAEKFVVAIEKTGIINTPEVDQGIKYVNDEIQKLKDKPDLKLSPEQREKLITDLQHQKQIFLYVAKLHDNTMKPDFSAEDLLKAFKEKVIECISEALPVSSNKVQKYHNFLIQRPDLEPFNSSPYKTDMAKKVLTRVFEEYKKEKENLASVEPAVYSAKDAFCPKKDKEPVLNATSVQYKI